MPFISGPVQEHLLAGLLISAHKRMNWQSPRVGLSVSGCALAQQASYLFFFVLFFCHDLYPITLYAGCNIGKNLTRELYHSAWLFLQTKMLKHETGDQTSIPLSLVLHPVRGSELWSQTCSINANQHKLTYVAVKKIPNNYTLVNLVMYNMTYIQDN